MNTNYEVFTQHKQGVPILFSDCFPDCVFELGEPIETAQGLRGFLTDVSVDGTEGVLDISTNNVYSALVTKDATDLHLADPIYYDPTTGQLTAVSGGRPVFGKAVRVSYDEVYPKVGAGVAVVGVRVVNS